MREERSPANRLLPGIVTLALLVVAVIHLMPLLGALGPARLATLYGLDFSDPNLAILMRHRAVLFGVLGIFFACAAFRRPLQAIALVVAGTSLVSFLALAWTTGDYNSFVGRVVVVDIVALVALVVGALAFLADRRSR